jgi:PTH1 family peptidyl-tRNA hydrolase
VSIQAVLGLGNPGREYAWSRHNLGFRVVDALGRECGVTLKRSRTLLAWYGRGECRGHPLALCKPATFMNESGRAARRLLDYYRLSSVDLLVVVDDVSLDPGKVRIRPRGGAGGHHGLESIIREIGSADFPRLRIGIGGSDRDDLTGHVLSPAAGEEELIYREAVESAVRAVCSILADGLEKTMNEFNANAKPITKQEEEEN